MKITVLIENTKKEPMFCCEHGLSILIEEKGQKLLLDSGSSSAFMKNAELMQISLHDISVCVLSHGHYDHSTGFADFLAENSQAVLYAMKSAGQSYYSGSGDNLHYIGLPQALLDKQETRMKLVEEVTGLAPGIWAVPHSTEGLEEIGRQKKLYRKEGESFLPDDFSHELTLVYEMEKGLILFNSCSHGGIENIILEVRRALPEKKLYAFVGGLHMKGKRQGEEICTFTKEEVKEMAAFLEDSGLEYLYTGHCTGEIGLAMLRNELGDKVRRMQTGDVIEI